MAGNQVTEYENQKAIIVAMVEVKSGSEADV